MEEWDDIEYEYVEEEEEPLAPISPLIQESMNMIQRNVAGYTTIPRKGESYAWRSCISSP